jgi:uncharacterized membrane protein
MADEELPVHGRPTISMVEPRGGELPPLDTTPRVPPPATPLPEGPPLVDISVSFWDRAWLTVKDYLPVTVQLAASIFLPTSIITIAMKNKKIIAFIVGLIALICTNFVGVEIPVEGNVALVGIITFLVGLISPTPGTPTEGEK